MEDLKIILIDAIIKYKEVSFGEAVNEATRLMRLSKKSYKEDELTKFIDILIETYTFDPNIRSSLDRFKMAQFILYTNKYISDHDLNNVDNNSMYEMIATDCRKDKDLSRKINNEYAMRGIIYGLSHMKEEKQMIKE